MRPTCMQVPAAKAGATSVDGAPPTGLSSEYPGRAPRGAFASPRNLSAPRAHLSAKSHHLSSPHPHLYSVQSRSHPMRFDVDVAPNHLRFAHRA